MNKSLTALVGPTLSAGSIQRVSATLVVGWPFSAARYDARNENVEIQTDPF